MITRTVVRNIYPFWRETLKQFLAPVPGPEPMTVSASETDCALVSEVVELKYEKRRLLLICRRRRRRLQLELSCTQTHTHTLSQRCPRNDLGALRTSLGSGESSHPLVRVLSDPRKEGISSVWLLFRAVRKKSEGSGRPADRTVTRNFVGTNLKIVCAAVGAPSTAVEEAPVTPSLVTVRIVGSVWCSRDFRQVYYSSVVRTAKVA